MDDRWPYPVSQTMQRQTGSRIKPLRVPETPPTAFVSVDGDKEKSIEPKIGCKVAQHSEG